LAIARIIKPHVAEVVIVNTRRLKAIAESKQKTDRHDAKTLAQLLAAGMLSGFWQPDEAIRALRRRVARRARLVSYRARFKNEILAVLHRNLKHRPPMSDPFGVAGQQWLSEQMLVEDERDTVDAALRQIDFLTGEITKIERQLAGFAVDSSEARWLMTVPGVGLITAVAFLGQVGEISRFADSRQLVGYLGLDPKVRQSGASQATTGRISKEGSALVRHVLVEAAHTAIRSPGPLRAFFERVRARRGHAVAIVAVARKMCVLFWHLLTRGENYAYQMPIVTAKKLRKVELTAGAPTATSKAPTGRNAVSSSAAQPKPPRVPTSATSPTGSVNSSSEAATWCKPELDFLSGRVSRVGRWRPARPVGPRAGDGLTH